MDHLCSRASGVIGAGSDISFYLQMKSAMRPISHQPQTSMNWGSAYGNLIVQTGRDADCFTASDQCIKSLDNNPGLFVLELYPRPSSTWRA